MSPEFLRSVRAIYEPLLGRPMSLGEVEEYGRDILHLVAFPETCTRDKRLVRKMGVSKKAAKRVPGIVHA